jgi:hypothetical protein
MTLGLFGHPHHYAPFDETVDEKDRRLMQVRCNDQTAALRVALDQVERLEYQVAHLKLELARARGGR